jgi:predicted small integral membrane protein
MTQEPDLKEIQKRAYMSYHQDGIIDIFVGLYILTFGLGAYIDIIFELGFAILMPVILAVVMVPIWYSAKRAITMPRIGFVKFGPSQANRLMVVFIGLAILGLAFSLIFAISATQAWVHAIMQYGMIILGLAGFAMCCLFGYSMGLRRLYAYGLLTLILFVGGYFVGIYVWYLLIALGIVITVAGFYLLISFVRKYPLPGDRSIAN